MRTNASMALTKAQQSSWIIGKVFLGLLLVIGVQTLLSVPTSSIKNTGAAEIYDNISTAGIIFVLIIYCKVALKRNTASLGFNKVDARRKYFWGVLLGLSFITLVFLINLLSGAVAVKFDPSSIRWLYILVSLVGFMFQGMMEETVCRGFIMNSLGARYGVLTGVIVNSVIFALLHSFNNGFGLLPAINLFLIGLLLSLMFYWSDSLFFVSAFHTAWNFTIGPIYGVKTSGIPAYSGLIETTGTADHTVINGGLFGFEGGVSVTVPTLLLLFIFMYLVKSRSTQY